MKVRIINGPNLNMLGIREPHIYGDKTYGDLVAFLHDAASDLDVEVEVLQSNSEGDIIGFVQAFDDYDALIINPAGYSHTSVAILDALLLVDKPKVEVHLSDIDQREDFRRVKLTAKGVNRVCKGGHFNSYLSALTWIKMQNI